MNLRRFLVTGVALVLMSASMVFGETINTGNWPPAKKQAFDQQIGQYAPAYNALQAVFSATNNKLFTESQSGSGNNIRYTFTVKPVVEHLWNVDAPVQGRDTQSLIKYLKSRNHPKNGDVYMWYAKNYQM